MCSATFFLQLPIDISPIFAIRSQKRRFVTLSKDLHLPVQPGFENKGSEARACVLNSPLLPHVSVWHSLLNKDPLTEIPLLCFRQPWFIGPAATLVNPPLLRNTECEMNSLSRSRPWPTLMVKWKGAGSWNQWIIFASYLISLLPRLSPL